MKRKNTTMLLKENRRYYKILSFTQIFLNAITGTTLLTLVFGKGSKVAEIIALILTIIATILASIQKLEIMKSKPREMQKLQICI